MKIEKDELTKIEMGEILDAATENDLIPKCRSFLNRHSGEIVHFFDDDDDAAAANWSVTDNEKTRSRVQTTPALWVEIPKLFTSGPASSNLVNAELIRDFLKDHGIEAILAV